MLPYLTRPHGELLPGLLTAQTSLAPQDRQLPVASRGSHQLQTLLAAKQRENPAIPGSRRRSAPPRAAMGKRPLHPAAMFPAGPRAASAAILPRPQPPPAALPPRRLLGPPRTVRQRPVAAEEPCGRSYLALLGDLHRHDEPGPAERREQAPWAGLYPPSAAPHWLAAARRAASGAPWEM